jgi:hypothetical protein
MAQQVSHLRLVSSTSSALGTRSQKARLRAAVLRRLANDLEKTHDVEDEDGGWRICAVTMLLVNEEVEDLDEAEIDYVRSLRVPPTLLAGGAR